MLIGKIAGGYDDKFPGIDVAFHRSADPFRGERGDFLFEVSFPKHGATEHGATEMAQAAQRAGESRVAGTADLQRLQVTFARLVRPR